MTTDRRTLTFTDDFEGAEPPGIHSKEFNEGGTYSLGVELAVVALELGRARCATKDEAEAAGLPYTGGEPGGADADGQAADEDVTTILVAPGKRTNRDGLLDWLEEHGDDTARTAFVELMQDGHTVTKAELVELCAAAAERVNNPEPAPVVDEERAAIIDAIDSMTEQELLAHLSTRGVELDPDDDLDALRKRAYTDAGVCPYAEMGPHTADGFALHAPSDDECALCTSTDNDPED